MDREASALCKYLVGQKPSSGLIQRYTDWVHRKSIELSSGEKKLWMIVIKIPFLLPALDIMLSLFFKNSGLRQRIYAMLVLLETDSDYSNHFLNKKFSYSVFFIYTLEFLLNIILAMIFLPFFMLFIMGAKK